MFKWATLSMIGLFICIGVLAIAKNSYQPEPEPVVNVTMAIREENDLFEFGTMQVVKAHEDKVVLGRDLEQPLLNRHIEVLESVGKFYTHSYPTANGKQMVTAFLTLDLEGPHPIAGETVFVQFYQEPACAVVSFYRNPTGEPEAAQACTAGCDCEFETQDVPAKNFFAKAALEFMRMLQLTPRETK